MRISLRTILVVLALIGVLLTWIRHKTLDRHGSAGSVGTAAVPGDWQSFQRDLQEWLATQGFRPTTAPMPLGVIGTEGVHQEVRFVGSYKGSPDFMVRVEDAGATLEEGTFAICWNVEAKWEGLYFWQTQREMRKYRQFYSVFGDWCDAYDPQRVE